MDQWRKCLTVVISGPASYRGAPGRILRCQASAEGFQALVAVAVDLSSFVGSRTPRQADTQRQWDMISLSHRPDLGAEAHPFTVLSKTTWTTCCEAA
jgi:hypothetical protein